MAAPESYFGGGNTLARPEAGEPRPNSIREANAAETLFRYLLRQEELGDTTLKYVSTRTPIVFEHGE